MPSAAPVTVTQCTETLPTYLPDAPDRNPMFLEKRVYQGSSGRVYPLPFYNRIAESAVPRDWRVVRIENEYLSVTLLPELGGRIHRVVDKTHGFDAIYHQTTIKPALVGLAGPWVSGGIEFNWPQHHRPSTFMPTDVEIERADDGAATVWMSEHDPMARMKGMHGVCLRPGRSVMELRVRTYNRTEDVQTFLWWANVATQVHEHYQSFFPPDATFVADHAKRAMASYPRAAGRYYGVDYGERGRRGVPVQERPRQYPPRSDCSADDLSWYANIPVPTSYMCMGSEEDFFGGYDHRVAAGIIHVADHRIAPGKKQWTWGNHDFGYAWDRNLTVPDANGERRPYIELMAGVFTDNQPDFSFIAPGETRAWSQFWYPYRAIGVAQHASVECALSLRIEGRRALLGVAVTSRQASATIRLEGRGAVLAEVVRDLSPDAPYTGEVALPKGTKPGELRLTVVDTRGREILGYRPCTPRKRSPAEIARLAATEPPEPARVATVDELFLTGLHLEQYRHATRMPDAYWREALRRDSGESRCHTALGRWHQRRGEFQEAEGHLRAAIERLTHRNPNPADAEAHYRLGVCLRHREMTVLEPAGRSSLHSAARDAFAKAAWVHAWQAPSHHALAELACERGDWVDALAELDHCVRLGSDNLRARNLRALVLRRLGRAAEAAVCIAETRRLDPLDWWSRHLAGEPLRCDTQVRLDLALDHARAGFHALALEVLADAAPEPVSGTAPLVAYYCGWLSLQLGRTAAARMHFEAAQEASPDYCFPSRLEEISILESALALRPTDARAACFLGNLLYDRRRHREAIDLWRRAVKHEPANALAWRNLGIGAYNILRRPALARRSYARACAIDPTDARLLYERDQLAKRLGEPVARRLRTLEAARRLVESRDDLSLELCALYNQTGRPELALRILEARDFQPWEGGEGVALGQHVRSHLLIGRAALAKGDAAAACRQFEAALHPPENIGEARHLLANGSDVWLALGDACAAAGEAAAARAHWQAAANFRGDFQEMSVRVFSEMTMYSALALERLGRRARARKLWRDLLAHARDLAQQEAKVDYFATSLPTMLLFEDDLQARHVNRARFIEAQARLGLGERAAARRLLQEVLRRDPAHAAAADLFSGL